MAKRTKSVGDATQISDYNNVTTYGDADHDWDDATGTGYHNATHDAPLRLVNVDSGNESAGSMFLDASGNLRVKVATATATPPTPSNISDGNIVLVDRAGLELSNDLSMGDNDITNVGDIALDSISSDAGTSVTVVLGTDAGDDFIVNNGSIDALLVEGDTGSLHNSTTSFPNAFFHRDTNTATSGLEIYLQFDNSDNVVHEYASLRAELVTNTAGSENGYFAIKTIGGGTLSERLRCDHLGNVIVNTSAVATNATDGFLYIPTCAGTPSGTPTAYSGRVPLVFDSSNNELYVYDGSWISVALS